jgi:DinB superfamily
MIPFYEELFGRFHELHADIKQALESLPPEAMDWTPGTDMNSVSVLVAHLTGAERYLVGDVVMSDPSNRDREAEFRVAGLAKNDLLLRLTDTEAYTKAAFETLKLSDLETTRTHPRHGNQVSVTFALTHALEHVATHLGHIQLTVQLWQQRH